MVRRGLLALFVLMALSVVVLVVVSCGDDRAVTEAYIIAELQPRLLHIERFALVKGQPTSVFIRADRRRQLMISLHADRPLRSVSLTHVASLDGTHVAPEAVPLVGTPRQSGERTDYGLFTSLRVEPGFYQLDLRGRGRIEGLTVGDVQP